MPISRRPALTLRLSLALVASSLVPGCGDGGGDPVKLPALTAAPLATERSLRLVHPLGNEVGLPPSDPDSLQTLLAGGWGETAEGPGMAVSAHTLDGAAPPAKSASPTLLVRFVHLADTQLADDESPARVLMLDAMGPTYASYRPQEAWGCRMLNAAVRTINKVHETTPVEFVLLGGDNADNAQTNEVDWFQGILGGAPLVDCDSGDDDDPVAGADNDPKDPFIPVGLAVPWRWVTGNHDVLQQGNFRIADKLDEYLGTISSLGTRDWAKPGAPSTFGPIVADARRMPLDRNALMAKVMGDGDGHGLSGPGPAAGKGYYHFDVAGGAVRIVVLDSAAETGSADGLLRRGDLETYVRPALMEAEAQGKYVILASHHGTTTLTNGGGTGGTVQPDAVLADEWRDFLGEFPHVMLHLGAHTHLFRAFVARPAGGAHPYFEAETDSLADWPGQVRMFEVWQHDTHLVIRAVPIDFQTEGDPLTAEARTRQAADFASGWVDPTVGPGLEDARAVELWFPRVP